MKITDFQTFVVGTPWRNLTYLVLQTDEGITGVGEARVVGKTHTVCEYVRDVRRYILGQDLGDIEALYRRFTLEDFGSAGEVVMTGLALVEMACWDILGKKAGMPVYQFIGGKVRDKVPAYANGWYKVERTPEAYIQAAKRVVAKGYLGLKFDPFGAGDLELTRKEFHRSIELIEAVHTVTGKDVQIFCEMHGRFAPHQAVEVARAIEKFAPGWIEEPCRPEDVPALKYVAAHTSLPIATGERLYRASQFRDLFEARCVHVIQPDINQCGGLYEVKKIASTAETYSVMVAPHNVGGIVSTTAAIHLMATLRNGKVLEHFNDFADEEVKKCGSPYPEVIDGHFSLPTGPGWGLELNMDFIREHGPRRVDGVIADPGLNLFNNPDWAKRGK
ncbi:MAG: mandelate racemase/muconate lactonizing enzyme family protein [Planctomycetes bacterium]|nr:mandelate racemase/muconate lactonizing enzyme family protein [Planctomycetota bacterium]